MNSIDAQILDVTCLSEGFPNEPIENKIDRDNFLIEIQSLLYNNKVIFVEGDEDAGKTTLISEFVKRNKENSVSIFFRPLNKIDYDIDYFFQNVNKQLEFLLFNNFNDSEVNTSIQSFRTLLHHLRKKYKNNKKNFYFVIDGLETNFKDNIEFIKEIIDSIPISDDFIKVLISGSQNLYSSKIDTFNKCKCDNITVFGFSKTESGQFLEIKDTDAINQIFKVTKGFPGRLKTVKRILKSGGSSIEELNENETYNNYIILDCEGIDLENEITLALLSILCFSEESFSIKQLSKILELDETNIEEKIKSIPILDSAEKVNFTSIAHKNFFVNKLRNNKSNTKELLIKYYTDYDTVNSKYELFKIFSDNGQWNKVQDIVDEDFVVGLIENTGSLQKVSDSLETVCKASSNLKNYPSIFKYSIIGSIINELDSYTFWESEILARLGINDYIGAINLAESAVLKVDRLRLLSLIARKQKELNKIVDHNLSNTIYEIYKSIDLSSVGNIIYDIVSNLIYAIPNLAIEIIESSSSEKKADNINNWIIAKLSFAAINSINEDGEKKIDAINKLNNPSAEKINRAITFLVGNYNCEKVIIEVKKIEDSNEKIRFLRIWLSNKKYEINDTDKFKILNYSLDMMVESSTEITINFDVLKDLSVQLPLFKNFELKSRLLERFKALETKVVNIGQSKDKFIYELNIFHTLFNLTPDKGIFAINKIIKSIDSLDDLLVKLESYSEVYTKLFIFSNIELRKKKTFVYHKILELSKQLLSQSANHYNSLTSIVDSIAGVDPILALEIINDVNTKISRDRLRILLLESYLKNSISKIDFDKIKVIQIKIENEISKEVLVKLLLDRLNEANTLPKEVIINLLYFSNQICKFNVNATIKIDCYILLFKIFNKNEFGKLKLSHDIKKNIDYEFSKIDREWEKIDYAYKLCSELVDIDKKYAKDKFSEAESIKNNTWLDSGFIAQVYINIISLTIKSFEGIINNKDNFDKEFQILDKIISNIPSELDKLISWTQVSLTLYLNGKIEFAKKVYDKNIFPSVTTLNRNLINIEDSLETLILVHIFNSSLATEIIKKLPYFSKEECCFMISNFYLNKKNPFNYYEGDILNNNVELQDIYNVISILEIAEMDNIIFSIIDNIYKSDFHKNSTNLQKADIIEKLNNIISKKLPDNQNIRHDGYKIISLIRTKLMNKGERDWKNILESAQKLENTSDRLFVNSSILEFLPFIKTDLIRGKEIFDSIINDLESLPNNYEFVDRVSQISETMFKQERKEWKKIIDKAFVFSNELEEGTDAYNFQKKMIDSIYRVDESIAKDLINSIDKENTDFKQKKLLKKYFDTLEISNKIKNNKTIEQKEREDVRVLVNGIKKTLGSLNSGKTSVKKIEDVTKYLFIGYKLPLLDCISVFSYYFANCSKTQSTKNTANEISKLNERNFHEMIQALKLIQFLSRKRKLDVESNRKTFIEDKFKNNYVINHGSREEAFKYISEWAIEQAEEFIIIADPYFKPDDLNFLKTIKQLNKEIVVRIITNKGCLEDDIQQKYNDYWKKISDEEPPITKIIFCWVPDDSNNTPFHDRCILTKNSGLRLGTSLNSLGLKKDSEISLMELNEVNTILEDSLNGYLNNTTYYAGNLRIKYKSFFL